MIPAMVIQLNSIQYLPQATVDADVSLGTQTVEQAMTYKSTKPVEDDWEAAAWEGSEWTTVEDGVTIHHRLVSKFLYGGDATEAGNYSVWIRVTDSPEIPELHAGYVRLE